MNNKIKKALIISLLLLPVLALPMVVAAQPNIPQPTTTYTVDALTKAIVRAVWWIFATIAIIMFIVAGLTFMTAQGDPEKIATARNAVIWGIAGVIVAVISWGIVKFAESLI